MSHSKKSLSDVINHLKSVGYIYPSSEIYGGLANTYDYGPLGALLKNNLKALWIKKFILEENNYLIDTAIFMNSKIWEASGHLKNFIDISIDCKNCKKRFRADHLIENYCNENNIDYSNLNLSNLNDIKIIIDKYHISCPSCKKFDWSLPKNFNLILNTNLNINNENNITYLRPETAQGIFVNFNNILRSMRTKLPFGVGQIGKSFRNEVTPDNYIFRTKEFEQMELEYFCYEKDEDKYFKYYQNKIYNFLINDLQINTENIHIYNHPQEKLSHYSKNTLDFEYNFPFGQKELWGLANRGNYDLKQHSSYSNEKLEYLDPINSQKIVPSIIEPSVGVDRLLLAIICDSYSLDIIKTLNNVQETRIVLKLPYKLSPYIACICPLSKELEKEAKKVFSDLLKIFSITYEGSGSIGKRYRRQDAIGTPLCITFDYDSLKDAAVTIRNRDTMKQERILINKLPNYILNFLK